MHFFSSSTGNKWQEYHKILFVNKTKNFIFWSLQDTLSVVHTSVSNTIIFFINQLPLPYQFTSSFNFPGGGGQHSQTMTLLFLYTIYTGVNKVLQLNTFFKTFTINNIGCKVRPDSKIQFRSVVTYFPFINLI